ncbi:MipA/OmpV family protein [Escherichia coli]
MSPVVAVWQVIPRRMPGGSDASLTPAKYPIGEHVVLMASAGYSELPEEITDSPMIDRNESFTFVTGVSWRF